MTTSAETLTVLDPAEQRARWGDAVDPGLAIVPVLLLRNQARLGLTAVEAVLLFNLVAEWHERDEWPGPRPDVLARRIGVDVRTVQRSIARLKKMGLMRRLPSEKRKGPAVRRFDLSGLRRRLEALNGSPLAQAAPKSTAAL